MYARANAIVDILRGTTTDEFGDQVDTLAPVKRGVRASIIETSRRVYLPAEGASRVVHAITGRVSGGVEVKKDDRWLNQKDGKTYLVVEIKTPTSLTGVPDVEVELSYTD